MKEPNRTTFLICTRFLKSDESGLAVLVGGGFILFFFFFVLSALRQTKTKRNKEERKRWKRLFQFVFDWEKVPEAADVLTYVIYFSHLMLHLHRNFIWLVKNFTIEFNIIYSIFKNAFFFSRFKSNESVNCFSIWWNTLAIVHSDGF